MSPFKNDYWLERQGLQKARTAFENKALELAIERICAIEKKFPKNNAERKKEIKKRFLTKPVILKDRSVYANVEGGSYFDPQLQTDIAFFCDIQIDNTSKRSQFLYSDDIVKSMLFEEAIVLTEQFIRFFYWHEYNDHKIKVTDLPSIERLIGAVQALEIKERGFKVVQDNEFEQKSKTEAIKLREIEFANDIDRIIIEKPNIANSTRFKARDACIVYRDEKSPHVEIETLQNRYIKAKKIRNENKNWYRFRHLLDRFFK